MSTPNTRFLTTTGFRNPVSEFISDLGARLTPVTRERAKAVQKLGSGARTRRNSRLRGPRNGKPHRFDPAGFPCFGTEVPKHAVTLAARPIRASGFFAAT